MGCDGSELVTDVVTVKKLVQLFQKIDDNCTQQTINKMHNAASPRSRDDDPP
jgi:hypothetical protein